MFIVDFRTKESFTRIALTRKEESLRKSIAFSVAFVILVVLTTNASAMRFSAGGFAGLNMPIAMEDVKSGMVFGFKGRVVVLPAIAVDPNLSFSSYGDGEADVFGETQKRDGGKITSFGVDLAVGGVQGNPGLSVYGILGLGSSKWSRDGIDDVSELSYYLGIGLEYSINEMISLDFRGRAQIIPHEDGSYKNGCVTAGVNFYFGTMGGNGQ
jgi:opacity protein-like surface antigen